MPQDKSLLIYGAPYHWLLDRPLADARRLVTDLIPPGSSVLDIGCGTGMLCAALREKNCRVTGLDLSLRMLNYAREHSRFDDVEFVHGDATDLSRFADRSFDYATMMFLVHELPLESEVRALSEAARVAVHVVIADSTVPLPKNFSARGLRFVETTVGRDHSRHFKAFMERGGIGAILEAAKLPLAVTRREIFWHGCRELIITSRAS